MWKLIARHPLLTTSFVLTVALACLFAVRVGIGLLYWPAHLHAPVEAWMPVGYVAQSWEVPREVLAAAIGSEAGSVPGRSIASIAAARGESPDVVIGRIENAIADYRGANSD